MTVLLNIHDFVLDDMSIVSTIRNGVDDRAKAIANIRDECIKVVLCTRVVQLMPKRRCASVEALSSTGALFPEGDLAIAFIEVA